MNLWRDRYRCHRKGAKRRNIPFLLTFEEWSAIWRESGKWDHRGVYKGQYCMARYQDKGAYELGNVRICLVEENHVEATHGEWNPAFGKNYWLQHTPEQREKHVTAIIEANSKPKSAAHRAAISAIASTRRWVLRDGRHVWAHPGDADYPTEL